MSEEAERIAALIALRRGERPVHMAEEVEHLLAMVITLVGEVSVMAEKVIRLERELAGDDAAALEELRERPASPEEIDERAASREALIERVFQSVTGAYSEALAPSDDGPN